MARGWRVIDATDLNGQVLGRRGQMLLQADESQNKDSVDVTVPAEDIALLLIGPGTQIEASTLHYAAKHDVVIVAADWRKIPYASLMPWSTHGRVATRHIAQANQSTPRKKHAWQQIVKAKIYGQARALDTVDSDSAKLLFDMVTSVRSGDPDNREGLAARLYWGRLFPWFEGFRRDRHGRDTVNPILNYGYMILRGYGIRAVVGAGLCPPLGVFHRNRANYFNLVDDLIEPFRPLIDAVVATVGPDATIEDAHIKHTLTNLASSCFSEDNHGLVSVLDDFAQQYGKYVEGDEKRLQVPKWSSSPPPPAA